MIYILLAVLSCLFQIFDGAFLLFHLRFFFDNAVYFATGVYILHSSRGSISFAELFLLLLAAPILIFFPSGNHFSAQEFYPLTYSPFLAAGFLYWFCRSKRKWIVSIVALLVFALLAFVVYPNYWASLSGKEVKNTAADPRTLLPLNDATGTMHTINGIEAKVIVLDVWHSKCAACFRGFPRLEALYTAYSSDTSIYIGSLNLPFEEEAGNHKAFDAVANYHFHKLKARQHITDTSWNIRSYPTILVFDKQKRLRYQGALQTDKAVIVNNIHRLIERLKKE